MCMYARAYSEHPLIQTPTGLKNLFELANVCIIESWTKTRKQII